MLSWIARRGEKAKRIEADADGPVRAYGEKACSVARRREHETSSQPIARDWNRIALAIAERTHKGLGLDTATPMATNASIVPGPMTSEADWPRFFDERSQLEELERILREETVTHAERIV